jgi:hypothetical protein
MSKRGSSEKEVALALPERNHNNRKIFVIELSTEVVATKFILHHPPDIILDLFLIKKNSKYFGIALYQILDVKNHITVLNILIYCFFLIMFHIPVLCFNKSKN